ncbi:MAG: sterol desaturase family protein [Cyanobacteria bacterium J06560_5]
MDFQQVYQFVVSTVQGLVQSFIPQIIATTVVYLLVWKLFAHKFRRFRIQPVKRAGATQIKAEIKNSIIVILFGLVTSPMLLMLQNAGYIELYADPLKYGWGYLVLSTVVLWVVNDIWFYASHRLLHHPKIYRYIHAIHHESLDTTPYTALSFHYLEPVILTGGIYLCLLLFPVSVSAIAIVQILGLLNNIKSHLGYEFYPKFFDSTPLLNQLVNSVHHNQHHTRYNGNYGLSLRIWDQLFGTEFDDYDQVVSQVKNRKALVRSIDNSTYRPLKISKIVSETPDTTSIYFHPKDKNFYSYLPGQHLNLRIKVNGRVYDRIFSLSSSPVADDFLRITVKQHSIVTNYLRNEANVGDEVQALYPSGQFNLWLNSSQPKQYLMVAGGSGITPLYSMIRSILAKEKDSKVSLLYANKSEESAIFADEIEALSCEDDRFTAVDFISGQRRLSKAAIAPYVNNQVPTEVYLCGPTGLKTAMKKYLTELGFSKQHLHQEDFADGHTSFFAC